MEKLNHKTWTIRLVTFIRTDSIYRAQFMSNGVLFAIFTCTIQWGFKTPAILSLFFRSKRTSGEEDDLSQCDRAIQISARFLINSISVFVFYMLIVIHYYYKVTKQLSWWNVVLASLGTWVRLPGPLPFSYYFVFHIPTQRAFQGAPYIHYPSVPHVSEHQFKGLDLKNTICIGQWSHTQARKVKRGLQ